MRHRKNMTYDREVIAEPAAIVFRLNGVLAGTSECYDFVENVRDEIHNGNTRIVLNIENLEMVNSTGIGILASCYTSITNTNGFLSLVAASDRVQSLLEVVHLWQILNHHETEAEALAAMVQ